MNQSTHLRILAIVPYKILPAVMGGQKGIALFYKFLAQHVSLTCLTVRKSAVDANFKVMNELPDARSRYVNPFLFFKIRKWAVQEKSTHVLFEHPYYAWMIVLFRWSSSLKIIVHSHNIESERFKSVGKWWWKILWLYEKMAYSYADKVWFKTEEDKQYAITQYGLKADKCSTIPYGVEQNALPSVEEINEAKQTVCKLHAVREEEKILLFNGTLNYKPNLDALRCILDKINPLLQQQISNYKILVCGKGLPNELKELTQYQKANIIYAGFVEDIDLYFKACDVFLNPLVDGGGVKTKLVEALGFGKQALSFANGAIGVDAGLCGGRLHVVSDHDMNTFASAVVNSLQHHPENEHDAFYATYTWSAIATKATQTLR